MANKKEKSISFAEQMELVQRQFKNLDAKDPSLWPALPKGLLCLFIAGAVAAVSWFAFLQDYEAELEGERNKEIALRTDYQKNW